MKLSVIILAAGQGKRMKNPDLPKVLCPLCGKPMLSYILDTVSALKPDKTVVVAGHMREKVIAFLGANYRRAKICIQEEQLGTGHAVRQAEPLFNGYDGDILILAGDVPLIGTSTLEEFYKAHTEGSADLSVLSTTAEDPTGYGRIVRTEIGIFSKIVEQKDATDAEKEIHEINSGIYLVKSKLLFLALSFVSNENNQKEYYLTDIIQILNSNGAIVKAFNIAGFDELQGVNSVEDMARAEKALNKKKE